MTSKLTIEQAKRLRNDFECWQQDYDPKDDKEQYDMFGRGMVAMDMLIAGMYQEPVAYTDERNLGYIDRGRETAYLWGKQNSEASDVALYRHVQPAPVVHGEVASANEELKRTLVDCNRYNYCSDAIARVESACRAALLQAGNSPAQSDCCPGQSGNSPVIPDGFVMVPKEPTAEMILSAMRDNETGEVAEIYELMLAAAPQSPGSEPATVPGKWIPVSERMPEVGDILLTAMGGVVNVGEMECSAANCRFFTSVISGRELPATHWMPLPAAPQEVKGE
ncbi:DUF551 domain-containing protein [Klebsiella pneumoniae]